MEEMQKLFGELTKDNQGMLLLLGRAIELGQKEKQNEKVKANT